MIKIEHLRKEYKSSTPLKDVCVTINKGDIIAIIGPSGTGKSTFIRCINLLEKPTSGHIYIDGEDITDKKCDVAKLRRKMGMVFQHFNLFPHLTIIENIMMPQMDLLKKSKQDAYDKAMEILKSVGLADKILKYPDEISGGQKQRVAIARALAMNPEIILLDEPTSALDPTMIGEVQSVIRSLAKQGTTMIIVTHEMKFAREISNRVFYMDQGGIYEDGTPEQIFENPQKELTRKFIKQLKVLEIEIETKMFDFIGVNTNIEEFGIKHKISHDYIDRIKSYFEEMCVQLIISQINESFKMNVTIEYSEKNDDVSVTIKYDGELFNPLELNNDLAILITKKVANSIDYSVEEGINKVVAYIK